MAVKPSIPKGTRDFSQAEMSRRNYIFDTIRNVFDLYGFGAIETPAMENLSSLMGKYGEEGDKLLFKVLNSGDWSRGLAGDTVNADNVNQYTAKVSEKGLRYDLTVPFARYVVQHRNDIIFPFKRYQIQPVWRADRPQKGRYREFYQCDADVVGSDSLLNEVELLTMIDQVFIRLGISVTIKLNNRKILAGIAEIIGAPEALTDITVAIDKIDKIGLDAVKTELSERGLSDESIARLQPMLQLDGTMAQRLDAIEQLLESSTIGSLGVKELRFVADTVIKTGLKAKLDIDFSLARGLNYYTGTIIEVKANDVSIGSICGGGRYDNLTGVFGVPGLSGVGISFGADRIYDVLNSLGLYPQNTVAQAKILFLNMGDNEALASLDVIKQLRSKGISAEIYPDAVKMKKQMAYADNRKYQFVGIIGESEMQNHSVTLKNMTTGLQTTLPQEDLAAQLA